jgi:hypothetical protein
LALYLFISSPLHLFTSVLSFQVLTVDVDYQRSGKTVFTGTTLVGFVGVFNGMRPGGWSYSLDAREKGGKVADNFIEALVMEKARTPCQHARFVLESEEATDFDAAVKVPITHLPPPSHQTHLFTSLLPPPSPHLSSSASSARPFPPPP